MDPRLGDGFDAPALRLTPAAGSLGDREASTCSRHCHYFYYTGKEDKSNKKSPGRQKDALLDRNIKIAPLPPNTLKVLCEADIIIKMVSSNELSLDLDPCNSIYWFHNKQFKQIECKQNRLVGSHRNSNTYQIYISKTLWD